MMGRGRTHHGIGTFGKLSCLLRLKQLPRINGAEERREEEGL